MLLEQTVAENDARLVDAYGQPSEGGFVLKRGWPWIAGTSATGNSIQELLVALNAVTTYTDPKANTKTYTGNFVVTENRGYDENQDGTAARDCQIVQLLTKYKTVTNVSSLGTPDKGSDKLTLNYLGFEEGEQSHIYHKYTNLDPAAYKTVLTLSPTESGYTIVKREFKIEANKTGTFYVVFEYDLWTSGGTVTWGSDKKRVGRSNDDGNLGFDPYGLQEQTELTGLSKGAQDSAFVAAQSGGSERVVLGVRRVERANGEYVVSQQQGTAFAGTAAADATILRIRSNLRGSRPKGLVRVWWRRTLAAKETLIGGVAVGDATIGGDSYFHDEVTVTDNGDGTFNVTQDLTEAVTTLTVGPTYFDTNFEVKKTFTRSKDDQKKEITYRKYIAARPKESSAVKFISDQTPLVRGSESVVKKGTNYYVATCMTLTNVGNWA